MAAGQGSMFDLIPISRFAMGALPDIGNPWHPLPSTLSAFEFDLRYLHGFIIRIQKKKSRKIFLMGKLLWNTKNVLTF